MDVLLRNIFELQVKSLAGFKFQDFVTQLFLLRYGATGFIPPRKVKDKTCDGIITGERRIVACYAPEKANNSAFLSKIESDFEGYRRNWEIEYPNWMFVTNQKLSPDWIKKVDQLKKGTPIIGIENLAAIIEGLEGFKRRKLGKYLGVNDEYFTRDYLKEILDDLLKGTDYNDMHAEYSKAAYIGEKIELNFKMGDIDAAKEEYEAVFEYFSQIEAILKGYENDGDIDKVKVRILRDYNDLKGSFKERLSKLTDRYLEKYSNKNDDDYHLCIRAILIYHFEQCLIGRKTGAEK